MLQVAPYGSWRSPISAELVAAGGVALEEVKVAGDAVRWLEGRPLEGGRRVVCGVAPGGGGEPEDLTPEGFNVRTRVHEYGGGSWAVHGDILFFANFDDQRLYRQDPGSPPRPITPEPPTPAAHRYADAAITPDGRVLVCVRERHEADGVINELVTLPADGSEPPAVLAGGRDFYASPRLSPDGRRLAWLEWDHPNMPWDGTELKVAELSGGVPVGESRREAGGPDESIFQPEWSPGGTLHFVSDRSGWWNLYRIQDGQVEALAPMQEEFGHPQWVFGLARYAFLPGGRIACIHGLGPLQRLGVLDPDGHLADLDLPFTAFYPPQLRVVGDRLACVAGSPTRDAAVVLIDPAGGQVEVLRQSGDQELDPGYLSVPRQIEFPTEGGQTAYALYYPPANRDFTGPDGERPPLLVTSHGGPTAEVVSLLADGYQFFTSRGIAVVESRRPASWPTGARSTRGGWPSGEAAPAATPPCARSPSATCSPPAPATTAWPTRRRWPATPTSSSPATWTASSARGRRRPSCTGSGRRSTTPSACPARSSCCRAWRTRSSRPPRPSGWPPRSTPRASPTPTWRSPASSTASGGPRTSSGPSRPSCTSTAGCSASSSPIRWSRCRSRTCSIAILGNLPATAAGRGCPQTERPTASVRQKTQVQIKVLVPGDHSMVSLLGTRDELLKLIEAAFESSVFVRGNEITITGEQADTDRVARLFEELITLLERGDALTVDTVGRSIDMVRGDVAARPSVVFGDSVLTSRGRSVKPKTIGQKKYVDAIRNNTVVFGIGPAGTGKTYLAMAVAVQALTAKETNRLILTRPAVEAGEKLGFLPGTLSEKIDPYLRPLYDALYEMMDAEQIGRLMERGTIEVAPLGYMRGRTLNNSFIVLDEAQNTTPEQMKMFLTRLGFNSKAVVTGDITQIDLPAGQHSGLNVVREILTGIDDLSFVYLSSRDVVRHRIVQDIVEAYRRYDEARP